tara:strand:+ start:4282 stop:4716 length:435 start_codon:yes stop_codon:yes gene_type:complete
MLDEVFQSIYSSVVEAQNTIEQHYLGEITEDYFLADGTPKMILVKLPGADGKLKDVHIPAITLVPHYGLAIDEVSVEMKVKLSTSIGNKERKGNKRGRLRNIITDFSNRDGGKELATIKVKFKGKEPVEGLARIKDNLIKFIPT